MSRILKIMSIAVILFLAYIWFGVLAKSWKEKGENSDPIENYLDDEVDSIPLDDDFFNESISQEDINYDEVDKIVEEKSKIEDRTPINTKSKISIEQKYSSPQEAKKVAVNKVNKQGKRDVLESISQNNIKQTNVNGQFLVMAGSYLIENNADAMISKLNGFGYKKAEKVVFDNSNFHSVCVSRMSDHSLALNLSNELKNKGVDSYVHQRQN